MTQKLYLKLFSSCRTQVLDTHTQPDFDSQVTVGGGVSVNGTEFYQDGKDWEAWIPQTSGDNVAVLNLTTNEVDYVHVGELSIPEGARHFSRLGESDNDYFFTYADEGATRIDLDTHNISSTVPIGGQISRVAVVEFEALFNEIIGTRRNETLFGTPDADLIKGLQGEDKIFGDRGDDALVGSRGRDWIEGGQGEDTIHGGQGEDEIFGDRGDDSLVGNRGSDWIEGGQGEDTIHGGQGKDEIFGDRGDDWLKGGRGTDYVLGGQGADTLIGGAGRDFLDGGKGADSFILEKNMGIDTIHHFQINHDVLVLSEGLTVNQLGLSVEEGDTFIQLLATNQTLAILDGLATNLDNISFIEPVI